MKRIAIVISFLHLLALPGIAQEQYDALLSSRELTGGTARSLSMGGSFGALGGDLSVASSNPAGLAILRTPVFTFTPGIYYANSNARYMGFANDDYEYKMTLDNIGMVWASNNGSANGWAGGAIGYTYNKLRDYNQNILIGPVNVTNTTLLDMFTSVLNGERILDPDEYYEWLAWDADLILRDTITGIYSSDYEKVNEDGNDYTHIQQKTIYREGRLGEHAFSASGNFANKIFFGATVGIQRFVYSENTDHFENDENSQVDVVNSFNFREHYDVRGTGYSLKLGVLAKPIEMLRLGAAVHLPTTINLDTEFYTDITSVLQYKDGLGTNTVRRNDIVFDYKALTPLKGIFSVGFVAGKYGLINVDYELVDYSKIRLRSGDESLTDVNNSIKREFQATSNLKIGAEANLGFLALRAGFAHYGDPFSSSHANAGQDINAFTGGFGIRSNDYFFDFGVMNYKLNEVHVLYNDNKSSIETNFLKILATIGVKF
jgi:hypothetical protein